MKRKLHEWLCAKNSLPNTPKNCCTWCVASVDIHAPYWTEYKNYPSKQDAAPSAVGCMFVRSCDLPGGVANHKKPAGNIPVERMANYAELSIIGGRETDADANIPLKKICGSTLPAALGTLLVGVAPIAAGVSCGDRCTAEDNEPFLKPTALMDIGSFEAATSSQNRVHQNSSFSFFGLRISLCLRLQIPRTLHY
ncbi:hypothetical protein [Pseudomonas sp. 10S4]|uniref:hypothetical protein n=1 Tax=Pseudomonas sp. 10S4 TaxID=3048583 RepID=UPI002AC8F1DF|nr:MULTISPECIES: hypothetical protein [unclassified Pseudomonas]MEB0222974.1 hypothetical protein [Pseudomonas sp. 5S1]MEB0292982.1 hypothetical protein [Pseudomonas sp. 10S4]WPX17273.1 hypothetical protein RHM58_25670 [Pseudomonas sp. 10S4]